jgi:hypothetical protein
VNRPLDQQEQAATLILVIGLIEHLLDFGIARLALLG